MTTMTNDNDNVSDDDVRTKMSHLIIKMYVVWFVL